MTLIILFSILKNILFLSWIKLQFNLKINNFFKTYCYAGLYLIIKLGPLIFIRLFNLGNEVNLKNLVNLWHLWLSDKIFFTILLSYFLTCLLIFYLCHKYLFYNFYKVYFYERYMYCLQEKLNMTRLFLFINFTHYSYNTICSKISRYFATNLNFIKDIRYYETRIKWLFLSLLLVVFIFECITNNFILKHFYYYLFIFMLFHYWRICSNAHSKECLIAGQILFEIFYCSHIIYIELTEQEITALRKYMHITRCDNLQEYDLFESIYRLKRYQKIIEDGEVSFINLHLNTKIKP